MIRLITSAFLMSLFLMTGCAHIYTKPGATQQDWQHDYNDCLVKANQAGYSGGDMGANISRNKFLDMCVQGQGWSQQTKETVQAQSQQKVELDQKRAEYKSKMDAFTEQNKQVCSKTEYAWIIKKSPCDPKDISMEQLVDDTKIAAKQKKSFLAFRKEAEAITKQMGEFLRTNTGADADRQWADYFDSTESIRTGYNLDLYNGKITWGEYNKARKDLIAKNQAEWRKIFQPNTKK